MPSESLGDALATDYCYVRNEFTEEQWQHFLATRRFVDTEVLPAINGYWEAAELPWPLMRRLPKLGLLGEDIAGYGCPGMTPLVEGARLPEESRLPAAERFADAGRVLITTRTTCA
jgi:glutaryl-CoA dehydrogenase